MDGIDLRPLSLGEMLDRTFTLYRKHFWVFVGIMALPAILTVPLNLGLIEIQQKPTAAGKVPSPQQLVALLAGYMLFAIVVYILYSVAMGAITFAVSDAYLGRPLSVRNAYERIRGRVWRLMGIIFAVWIRVFGVFIGCFFVVMMVAVAIPAMVGRGSPIVAAVVGLFAVVLMLAGMLAAVWFALRYAVSIQAAMLENVTIGDAIQRSVDLTEGHRGKLFVALLLSAVISYVGIIVFQGPFLIFTFAMAMKGQTSILLDSAMTFSGAIGGAITGPILTIVLVLCYYDLRIRKEGFDLQFMMASLDQPAPPASPVTPPEASANLT